MLTASSRVRRARALCACALTVLSVSLWTAAAKADDDDSSTKSDSSKDHSSSSWTIGGDLDYAWPINSDAKNGWGFGIRLGPHFHVPLLAADPEVGFTYHDFSGALSPKSYRGIAGIRLGIGEIFRIGPYGHIGIGHLDLSGTPDRSHTAFTYDVGGFLELTLLPLLNLGVHGGYNRIAAGDSVSAFEFATLGAHVAGVF